MVGLLGADVESYFLEGGEMKLEVGKKYKYNDDILFVFFVTPTGVAWGQLSNGHAFYVNPENAYMWAEWTEPKPPQYVPYTWEDREQLRGRWYRFKGYSPEHHAGHFSRRYNELIINSLTSSAFLVGCEWLDGTPCGKVVE